MIHRMYVGQYKVNFSFKMALFPIKSHTIPYMSRAWGSAVLMGDLLSVSFQRNKQSRLEGTDFRAC